MRNAVDTTRCSLLVQQVFLAAHMEGEAAAGAVRTAIKLAKQKREITARQLAKQEIEVTITAKLFIVAHLDGEGAAGAVRNLLAVRQLVLQQQRR